MRNVYLICIILFYFRIKILAEKCQIGLINTIKETMKMTTKTKKGKTEEVLTNINNFKNKQSEQTLKEKNMMEIDSDLIYYKNAVPVDQDFDVDID